MFAVLVSFLRRWIAIKRMSIGQLVAIALALFGALVAFQTLLNQQDASAWQAIISKVCGNSGKVRALEYLRWRRERLSTIDFEWADQCPSRSRVHLANVDLLGVNLDDIVMKNVNLDAATPRQVSMQEAILDRASLRLANLYRADLSGASLIGVDLRSAYAFSADLSHADLRDADLRQAELTNTNLSHADLSDAKLADADLTGANLSQTVLTGADIKDGVALRGSWAWDDRSPKGLTEERLGRVRSCDRQLRTRYETMGLTGEPRRWVYGSGWWRPCGSF